MENTWSLHTLINLAECDPETIRRADKIAEYVIKLCTLIEMRRFGDPIIVHFGEEERVMGYSLVQLIETSLIAGHFVEYDNRAFIDIHSCKPYDIKKAVEFTVSFFGAQRYTYEPIWRG